VFNKFYVCLKACKDNFISCRPALDGCFLKGFYGGKLLTVVGRDPNDQMLPLAYVVVHVECKDSWSWFLQLLIKDIGGIKVCATITFMSNQQKIYSLLSIVDFVCVYFSFNYSIYDFWQSLLPDIHDLIPGAVQRFCVRHLYSNFRKKIPKVKN